MSEWEIRCFFASKSNVLYDAATKINEKTAATIIETTTTNTEAFKHHRNVSQAKDTTKTYKQLVVLGTYMVLWPNIIFVAVPLPSQSTN